SFLSPTDGTILTTDGGANPGTVSTGALASVNSNVNISVTAQTSITFNDLISQGSTLNLATGTGNSATFSAQAGSVTFANVANTLTTAGGSLTLIASTSETLGQVTTAGGNLSLAALGGTLTQSGNANAGTGVVNATASGTLTVDALTGSTVTLTSTGGSISSAGANRIAA